MRTDDLEFEQYYFPKGTLFTWNTWAMVQNPTKYEDPELFWPKYLCMNMLDISLGV